MQRQGHKEMADAEAVRSSAVSKGRGCKWGGSGNRYIWKLQLGGLALGGRSRLIPRLLMY